jgi:hypothetical protein
VFEHECAELADLGGEGRVASVELVELALEAVDLRAGLAQAHPERARR